jgi:hypothetical protein
MKHITTLAILFISIITSTNCFAGKTVKIKLTGSTYEPIQLSIGETGRTEVISSLPYVVEVPKKQLPIKFKFQSQTYLYYDIDVPKKPFDTTGHVYVVKINETAMALRNNTVSQQNVAQQNFMGQSNLSEPIVGIDTSTGVNAAPITGIKNEKTLALIISNENYELASNVENATNDGLAFKEYCLKTLGIPNENLRYAKDLTYGKMRKSFSDILDLGDMMNGEANIIIYYAGHGIPDNQTKDAFLMPVDADGTDTDICMSLSSLYERINSKNINKCVIFLDACFSGAQRGGDMIVAARGVKLKPKETAPTGKTIVFSATSDDEAAYSHKQEKHGLFTYYLLSKLQESKGKTSLGELAEYIREKVSLESRRINNLPQTPRIAVSVGMENEWKSLKLIK